MIVGVPDRSWGNTGTIWSGIPTPFRVALFPNESHPAYVGGTAIGVHLLGLDDAPLLVAQGSTQQQPGGPWVPAAVLVVPPPDGHSSETGVANGTAIFPLAPAGQPSEAIASCIGAGGVCVLVRSAAGPSGPWTYTARLMATTGPLDQWPVEPAWLFEPGGTPVVTVRIALSGDTLVIASADGTLLRVTAAPRAGQARTVTVDLAKVSPRSLKGLVRLRVASLRLWGTVASVAMTAEPEIGRKSASHGVLARLQLGTTIALDSGFGNGGVWVSPRLRSARGFVCGGEVSRGIVGVAGTAAVAFGVLPDGSGLDPGFGKDGVCVVDLGGTLSSPVATNDRNEYIYVFALQRSTERTVGCRIRVRSGLLPVPNGTLDPNFGANGIVTLALDGAMAEPAGVAAGNFTTFVAATRALRGSDCETVPVLVAIEPSDGTHNPTFGAGGFALHGSVGRPASFGTDGACVFAGPALSTATEVQMIGREGVAERRVQLTLGIPGATTTSARTLSSGGLVLAGSGGASAVWLAKLTAAGSLDIGFGTGGIAQLAGSTEVQIVDVRADGRIVVQVMRGAWPAVALLHPDGTLDTSFGNGGYTELWRVAIGRVFPASGSTLLCVYSTWHNVGVPRTNQFGVVTNEFVQVGLARVTATGQWDPSFGWGLPSVFPPPARTATLRAGAGPTVDDEFEHVAPAGIATLGGKHYVVGTAFVGGRLVTDVFGVFHQNPRFPVLLVTRWNADGSPDQSFAPQVGGYVPDRRLWTAAGVLTESSSSILAYGMAAPRGTHVQPGTSTPTTFIRQPQPALFRVSDPVGIDLAFGQDGAATIPMQEFGPAVACAGVQLADGSVRLAIVDGSEWTYGSGHPQSVQRIGSSFGGVAQIR